MNGQPGSPDDGCKKRRVQEPEQYPAIMYSRNHPPRSQVKLSDLQGLLLNILADGAAPQWLSVRRRSAIEHAVVVLVPGLELGMFNGEVPFASLREGGESGASEEKKRDKPRQITMSDPSEYYPKELSQETLPEPLKPLAEIFTHVWPVVGTAEFRGKGNHRQYFRLHSALQSMLTAPIPRSQAPKPFVNKRTPITKFFASLEQQMENNFVIHPAWFTTPEAKESHRQQREAAGQTADHGWVDTVVDRIEDGDVPEQDIQQGSLTVGRKVIAVDCEMCLSEEDKYVLTRISLVDWDGETILDELIKPDVPIKDYLTKWSGITEAMLKDVTTSLSDIQKRLLEIFTPHTVLVGHSLESDLTAMKMTHPFLVDTSILYPHPGGASCKQKLRIITEKHLARSIQGQSKGHDSVEDALACIDLVKKKCEYGPEYGTGANTRESIFKKLERAGRRSAVVDWGYPDRGYGSQAEIAMGCKSDQDVVDSIRSVMGGKAFGKSGEPEKADLVWARLRELELRRNWWDVSGSDDVEAIRLDILKQLGRDPKNETEPTAEDLGEAVKKTVDDIAAIYSSLPERTAFMIYSGNGDPREVRRLQAMRAQHNKEASHKDWDDRSVKWTGAEDDALSDACKKAVQGIALMVVK
ncbi:hypothetical protein M011DRAFT_506707 [Sporormia fimetaria CBS 119925]|uniref:Exonuclease domain-containing protein n=1 Tax=Sporormia fimetaria CBS 119925 TaxID=1340428 RepID=A0A6A6VIZ5_9PLEO|nr:hypothetical protein M011DRAFT_506707 [Sporormia fimetaria CBS 119925]